VRRIFTDRARLVVYIESGDLLRLTAKARSGGKTLVEWARETLLGELEANSDVPCTRPVRMARRRPITREHDTGLASEGNLESKPRVSGPACKHGVRKGYRCWQCGGLAVIE
jgi:hypothetical protein